jgi:predicted NodU family carbamoyl transferase
MRKHIYVLGTGTSHDGSACLLKDGKICVAIEKERLTRRKHDGGNDREAIDYCLKAEGITLNDLSLIVQNANFGRFKFGNDYYFGPRPFTEDLGVPVVTISHHLAHAYSTIGTCPFDKFNVLVMDGCGNSFDDCMDCDGATIPDVDRVKLLPHLYNEKDSYYSFSDGRCTPLLKDFSEWGYGNKAYPLHPVTTKHSIGGLYGAVSSYCLRNVDDPGKLMGLAPYGVEGVFKEDIFELKNGRVFVNYDWMEKYRNPARTYEQFKEGFQYYADIACGVQQEVERAILYIVTSRLESNPAEYLCYSGGTALNAVANARIISACKIKDIYMEPAAGDNGLSIGCAFYGWLEMLKMERIRHDGSTCFGINYSREKIEEEIEVSRVDIRPASTKNGIDFFFQSLNECKESRSGDKACIQFVIEGYGMTYLTMNGLMKSSDGIARNPTCAIKTNEADFLKMLLYPKSFREMIDAGRITVSNFESLELLENNFSLEEFSRALRQKLRNADDPTASPINARYSDDYIRETAELLANGKIIGWFQGGSEFGPRSLGRRSILADPRKPEVRDFINRHIKFREDFRPFAPSVPREDVSLYFQTDKERPYMIIVDRVLDAYKDKIKSVVHVNNTCRIQTVVPEWNRKFHELLLAFKEITGISVLLNTSFNKRGMPIVETPRDAIDFFLSCSLDYLVMDKFIVGKNLQDQD